MGCQGLSSREELRSEMDVTYARPAASRLALSHISPAREMPILTLTLIPDGIPSMSVEVMSTLDWEKYSHEQFGQNGFGTSGAYKDVHKAS